MASAFVEKYKVVNGCPVTTTNTGITCDYISVKNAHKVTIIANLLQAGSHATELAVSVATTVAAGSATAMTALMPVWKNADVSATDTLVKSADADSIAATAGTTNQLLVMEILCDRLPAGYDCLAATLADSSNGANFATVTYLIETRYPQATPPTAILD